LDGCHPVSHPCGEDRRIFSPSLNGELALPPYANGHVFQIPGTQTAACIVSLGVERNRLLYLASLADAVAGKAQWRKVVDTKDAISEISFTADSIYFRTSTGAPRYKVMRIALADPVLSKAENVIAAGRDVIVSLAAARDALYVTQRRGATLALLRVAHRKPAKIEEVALPFAGYVGVTDVDPPPGWRGRVVGRLDTSGEALLLRS
jgi:protease II